MDNNYVVYLHKNKINNKVYIGVTNSIEKRFGKNGSGYLRKKKNGDYNQPLFARAIIKYGWDNFTHEILEDNLTKEEASKKEDEYIDKYDSLNPQKGYNIRKGGYNGSLSNETKNKLRETMKGRYDGEDNPFYGKQHSEETKRIIGEKNKAHAQNRDYSGKNNPMYGKKKSKKSIEKMLRTRKKLKEMETEEEKQEYLRKRKENNRKISKALKEFYKNHEHHMTGKKRSEEFKQHMKETMTGREFTDKWKENIGKSHAKYVYICVETGKEYYSSGEAMRDTGIDKASIRRAADGIQQTAGNLHWIKKEKDDEWRRNNE